MLKFHQTWLLVRLFHPCLEWNLWWQYTGRVKIKSLCVVGWNFGRNCHI
jgi:hypothetical protein